MQKKIIYITAIFLICFSGSVYSQTQTTAVPININFSHNVAEDTPKGLMANRFKDLVKLRFGDARVRVKVYPNGQLFDDLSIRENILANNIQIAAPSISEIIKISKRFQMFDIPFLFVSPAAANNFLKGKYGDRMLKLVERSGFKGLGFLNNSMKQFSSKTPLRYPIDIKDLKFGIPDSDVIADQFKQVGVTPIKSKYNEFYDLLKANKISGVEGTWSDIFSQNLHNLQPHIIETNHGYQGYMIFSSLKFWNAIPDDTRIVLEQLLKEAIEYGNIVASVKVISDRRGILESGQSEVHALSIDERKEWVKVMQPVWKLYENDIGSGLMQAAASSR